MQQLIRKYSLNDDVVVRIAAHLGYDELRDAALFPLVWNRDMLWQLKAGIDLGVTIDELDKLENMFRVNSREAYFIATAQQSRPYPGVEVYLAMPTPITNITRSDDFGVINYFYRKYENFRDLMVSQLTVKRQHQIVDRLLRRYGNNPSSVVESRLSGLARIGDIDWFDKIVPTDVDYNKNVVLHAAIEAGQYKFVVHLVEQYAYKMYPLAYHAASESGNLQLIQYVDSDIIPLYEKQVQDVHGGIELLYTAAGAPNHSLFTHLEAALIDEPNSFELLNSATVTDDAPFIETVIHTYWDRLTVDDQFDILNTALFRLNDAIVDTLLQRIEVLPARTYYITEYTRLETLEKILSLIPSEKHTVAYYNLLLSQSAGHGNLQAVTYLMNLGADDYREAASMALLGGSLPVFKYVHQNYGVVITTDMVKQLLVTGHDTADFIRYLISALPDLTAQDITTFLDISSSHDTTLLTNIYLLHTYPELISWVTQNASRYMHTDVWTYMHHKGWV